MTRKDKSNHWRRVLDRYAIHNGSLKSFCEQEGVRVANFNYWRRKLEVSLAVAPGFVELHSPPVGISASGNCVTLRLVRQGVELELPGTWTAPQLAALLNALT